MCVSCKKKIYIDKLTFSLSLSFMTHLLYKRISRLRFTAGDGCKLHTVLSVVQSRCCPTHASELCVHRIAINLVIIPRSAFADEQMRA